MVELFWNFLLTSLALVGIRDIPKPNPDICHRYVKMLIFNCSYGTRICIRLRFAEHRHKVTVFENQYCNIPQFVIYIYEMCFLTRLITCARLCSVLCKPHSLVCLTNFFNASCYYFTCTRPMLLYTLHCALDSGLFTFLYGQQNGQSIFTWVNTVSNNTYAHEF